MNHMGQPIQPGNGQTPNPVNGGSQPPRQRAYTLDVSDLIKSIPPQYLSTATPPPQRVTLQLPENSVDSAHGMLLTTLAQIYRVCPHLFSQPITEANDAKVRISVPVQQPAAQPLAQPQQRPQPAPVHAGQPQMAVAQPQPQMAQQPQAQPVMAAAGGGPVYSSAGGGGNGNGNGHSHGPSNGGGNGGQGPSNGGKSPFEVVVGQPGGRAIGARTPAKPIRPPEAGAPKENVRPLEPPTGSSQMKATGPTDCPPTLLTFELSKLLKDVEVRQLGIEVGTLEKLGQARLALPLVKNQLAMGRVVATISQLLENADERTRQLLARANPNLEVPIPLKDIFHQLPQDVTSFGSAAPKVKPAEVNDIETPFSQRARAEAQAQQSFPSSMGLANGRNGEGHDQNDVMMRADNGPAVPQEETPNPAAQAQSELDQLTGAIKKAAAENDSKALEDLDSLDGAKLFTATNAKSQKKSAQPAAQPQAKQEEEESSNRGLGFQGPSKDLELRAVFRGTSEFTPDLVVKKTNELPGVLGCVLFSRTEGIVAKSLPEDLRNGAMADQVPGIYEKVVGLSGDLGFHDTETFTLHTAYGVLSFYGEGDACLSVLQQGKNFEPGVRELLVLIGRGVAKLLDPDRQTAN